MRSDITNVVAFFVTAVIVLGACPHMAHAAQGSTLRPPGFAPLLPAETAWESRLPALPAAPAAQDDVRVYVPLEDDSLVALDRATGTRVWLVPSLGRSTPLVGHDRIHVPTAGALVTLDAVTGRLLWRAPVDGLFQTAVPPGTVVPGAAIVLRTGRGLLALREEDGSVLWEHAMPGAGETDRVTPGTDAVYVTDARGVAAIGLTDGTPRWRRVVPGTTGTPVLLGDRLLVGTIDRDLVALRAASGDLAWRWRLGGSFVGAAARGDVVYVSALDALLRALRRDGGNQIWRLELDTRPTAPPTVYGDVVVQAGNDPVLASIDVRTGMVVARHQEEGDLLGPPLIATGDGGRNDPEEAALRAVTIVLLFQDGRVVGLRPDEQPESVPAATATPPDRR